MDPTWLIEADVPGVDSQALQAEIRRQGMRAQVVKYRPGAPAPRDLLGAESIPPDGCVVFLGTMPVMRHIQLHRRWSPGGWCTFDRLACSHYYAYFGAAMLNASYTLMPGVEAIRQEDRLYQVHGRDGQVFVRPDPVWKVFPGRLVRKAGFELALAATRYDPTTLVLVAEPQHLLREWRLVVANGEVVAASQYRDSGVVQPVAGCPDEVAAHARAVLAKAAWRPDPLFVLDVCETAAGELRVLELNSFSCSGLYACDLSRVVEAAAACARKLA